MAKGDDPERIREIRWLPRFPTAGKKNPPLGQIFIGELHGAGVRNRTADLLITSELLYQLSYTSS